MHAEFSYAHFEWLFIVHTHHCTVKSRNLWIQVQEKSCTFCQFRPTYMALQRMTLKYRHKHNMHTMERLHIPIEQKCHLFSKHPAQQNWCFDYENNDKLHKMTTQNMRKKILYELHLKWTILIKYFSSYIKKCQTGTYFFGWVYRQVTIFGQAHVY